MKLSLKGRVKSLENMVGSIECEDYNELYYFIKSDIKEEYRKLIKKGDLVYFELKNNKNKRSKAFRISLAKEKTEKPQFSSKTNNTGQINIFKQDEIEPKEDKNIFKVEKIEKNIEKIKLKFKKFITENFIKLESYNQEINELIKLVVKDNIITETESLFLKEKIKELNLPETTMKNIEKYMFSNNPFFDNILSIIFKDGIVKENELNFLYEKSKENLFSKSFVNNRFWQYAINYHLNDLVKDDNFLKIIKLWYYTNHTNYNLNITKDWIILSLNVFECNNLNVNIARTLKVYENEIKKKYKLNSFNLNEIYNSFNNDLKTDENEKKLKNFNHLKVNEDYTKKEIYNFFNVPENKQGGKWNNGYCEHNGEWFIFANIGKAGKGYSGNEFDYDNSIDNYGDLNWVAINNSDPKWDSIKKLKNSLPYIFIRNIETKKHHWTFIGKGHCMYAIGKTPVKFKWKIKKENQQNASSNIIDQNNKKEIKWNDKFVSIEYKEEIINLIKQKGAFEASQLFLKLAHDNGKRNIENVMEEFEKIYDSLED